MLYPGACSASYTAPIHPLSVRLRVKEAAVEVIEGEPVPLLTNLEPTKDSFVRETQR
jgi:hypothetical protein